MDDTAPKKRAPKPARYSVMWLIAAPLFWFESYHRLYTHRWGEQITHGFGLFDGILLLLWPIIFVVNLRFVIQSRRQAARG
jgi:hypothetical protein